MVDISNYESQIHDAEDRPLHFLSYLRDITSRKEAEEQLHRSQVQLTEAQRLAHVGSWEWEIPGGRGISIPGTFVPPGRFTLSSCRPRASAVAISARVPTSHR